MTDAERRARIGANIAAERHNPKRLWWLSFVDPDRPEGQRFLGVCIVEARGPATAMAISWLRRCNPGGEICSFELEESVRPHVTPYLNRLLSDAELKAAGFQKC